MDFVCLFVQVIPGPEPVDPSGQALHPRQGGGDPGIPCHQDPLGKMALLADVEEVTDITRHGHDLFPAVGVQPIHFGLSIEDSLYGGLPLGVARCTPLASGRGRAGPWRGKSVAFVTAVRCRIRVGVRTRSAVIFAG